MRIYNTLTRKKEEFTPLIQPVRLYVCGITPYDTTHIGHAFTYVAFDALIRYLEYQRYQVRYVQNVTDVDDDILRQAKKLGVQWNELAQEQTSLYLADMSALNVKRPNVIPRASEEVPKILDIVDVLLSQGYAYRADGNVYFEVKKYPEYGQLSHLARDQMLPLARERGGYPDDPRKKDPLDFVLWQESAPGEPRWDSPWGPGRPGWHIECSAMSLKYLGETLDIHGGGQDLVFPHHESEIAQSESYTCQHPFSRFWMHTGMVRLGGIKMSKSLGNLIMVSQVLSQYSGNSLRLYLLGFHYREVWDYEQAGLERAQSRMNEITRALAHEAGKGANGTDSVSIWRDRFTSAMDDDLDTPTAVEGALNLAREISRRKRAGRDVRGLQSVLREMVAVLGLVVP
ncbi:MAG: cysteine--tRNA ligase [Chloroflexi bacterium]|nr:cysteine--tRNA ligase [Chloroflexota bacterium]